MSWTAPDVSGVAGYRVLLLQYSSGPRYEQMADAALIRRLIQSGQAVSDIELGSVYFVVVRAIMDDQTYGPLSEVVRVDLVVRSGLYV